jgi:uncharacterized protein YgiM (DUF1202 family)
MSNIGGEGPASGLTTGWTASRRVVLKATALVGAIAAAGGVAQVGVQRGLAQDDGSDTGAPIRAKRWVESEQLGTFTAQDVGTPKTIAGEFVFYAAGAHWDGSVGTWPLVRMRFSKDGSTYSDPITVSASVEDGGRPNRDGRVFSHLAFTDGAQYIQYQILDEDGNPTDVDNFAITYIDASAGPSLNDVFSPAALPTLQKPPIISRKGWGADESLRYDDYGVVWPPEYQEVEHVIIHHTDTPNFRDPLIEIRSIYYYHAIEQGWGDIGYNYLVDYKGNVYEGRYGGPNVVGGHAYQYAYGSSGIGTMGDFSIQDATEDAQAALVAITAWVGRNLDPLGRSDFHEAPNLPTICGHRDVNDSTCPGDYLYADLPGIRQAVADVLAGTTSPPGETVPPPPSGKFRNYDNAIVVHKVNLREQPSLSAKILAALQEGTLAAVLDNGRDNEGYTWYYIRTDTNEGYVAGNFLGQAPPGTPPPPNFAVGDFAKGTHDNVAIRSHPGLLQTKIAYLPKGSTVEITVESVAANNYRWYGVYDSVYKGGWMVQDYLTATDAPNRDFNIGDHVVVNTDVLNLRTGPGSGYDVIATMPSGTKGVVLDGPVPANGFTWWQLDTGYGAGWAAGQYLKLDENQPPQNVFQIGDTVRVVDQDGVNLRYSPSTSSGVVAALPYDTVADVVGGPQGGSGYTWYQFSTALGVGWAISSAFAKRAAPPPPPTVFNPGDQVTISASVATYIRVSPSRDSSTVARVERGTVCTVQAGPQVVGTDVWYKIQSPNGAGWVLGKFLAASSTPPPTGQFKVGDAVQISVSTRLNMRAAPTRDARTVAGLPNGTTGTVVGGPTADGSDTFYQVQTSLGTGWVLAKFLIESQAPPPSSSFAIGDVVAIDVSTRLNLRAEATRDSRTVASLPDGAIGEVVDGPTTTGSDTFYEIRTNLGTGWVLAKFLVASNAPPPSGPGLNVGDTAVVNTDALNLRSSPSTSASIVATMPYGTTVSIIGGPTSAGGYTWWQVRSSTYGTGWCAGGYLQEA